MTYDATAWSQHAPAESLQASYSLLGWTGPGAYRQALADAVTDCLHESYVQNGKPATLLDVACFTGEYYGRLKEMGSLEHAHYTGLDVTPEYVAAAAKRWPLPAYFEMGDAHDLDGRRADVVLCAGLLIHVADPARVIRECAKAAKRWLVLGVGVNPVQSVPVVTLDTDPFLNRVYSPGYIDALLMEAFPKGAMPIDQIQRKIVGEQGVWAVKVVPSNIGRPRKDKS